MSELPDNADSLADRLERRIATALAHYFETRLPQDWQRFTELHRQRSPGQVREMERRASLG